MAQKNLPPIVSPFDSPEPASATSSSLGYLWMFLWGVVILGIVWLIGRFMGLLPVTIIILLAYFVSSMYVSLRIFLLGKRLQFVVRTLEDLAAIRTEVNLNMKTAYLMMVTIWPLFIAALLLQETFCFFLLMAVNFLVWPFVLVIERKFKGMKVLSEDPAVETGFEEILARWKEPVFGLKL